MTAPSTAREAAHSADEELALVAEAFNAHRMAPRLRVALSAGRGAACHVLDAKYEPGVRCTVLYGLGDLLVRGDLLVEAQADHLTGAAWDGEEAVGPVVAPGVRLHVFPRDPDLPSLATVSDADALARVLQEALPDAGRRPMGCRVRLMRYRPGRRATLAVDLRGSAVGAREGVSSCVVKVYNDRRKAAAVAVEAGELAVAADPCAPLRLAPVLAHVPELSLVVQGWERGARLDTILAVPGPAAAAALRRAATALAALHRLPPVGERRRPVDRELARFAARSAQVARVDDAVGGALGRLASRLAVTATSMPDAPVGLVHGDCKPSQFLVDADRHITLLDLDSCGRADPAGDVGTFLATLRQRAAGQLYAGRTTVAGAAAGGRLADVFLHEYVSRSAAAADRNDLRRRISWYEAVAFERKALRCFARSPRSPLTSVLVDLGQTCLDRIGGAT
jgi:aminoglycoside phosphotransferase (APT) family kinase protein